MSLIELIDEVREQICDDYCRFPREDMDDIENEELYEEHCKTCPLFRLTE